MKKSSTFHSLLQTVITEEEVRQAISEIVGYVDKARKFTVYDLFQYWAQAAFDHWSGFRDGADKAASCGLLEVDYSTFSKKAKEVPFTLFKRLFDLIIKKCNRITRRQLKIPKDLLLIDSTVVTVGKTRLSWAPYHGERAGIKLHVALTEANTMPMNVVETVGIRHDGPIGEELVDDRYIIIADRAYGKIERFDRYKREGQSFVIRLKGNVKLKRRKSLKRQKEEGSPVLQDFTCRLGTTQCRSEERHRVVIFRDANGNEIQVVTDLMLVSAECIAQMYKARWQIEIFFRWIKQNLNVPTLFGTTENAVYGQLNTALIVYVLLKWLYNKVNPSIPGQFSLTFICFVRLLGAQSLPTEWRIGINRLLYNRLKAIYQIPFLG
jgi:hypothetical protein